jgi:orotate phosphoribosyltransferase-like protein
VKGLDRFFKANAAKAMQDINFHDFMEMMEEGMTQSEIAKELGVSRRVVEWLSEELEKDV